VKKNVANGIKPVTPKLAKSAPKKVGSHPPSNQLLQSKPSTDPKISSVMSSVLAKYKKIAPATPA